MTSPTTSRIIKYGSLWVAGTSALALPLGYLRNWLLSQVDPGGQTVGILASILLLFSLVQTFVLFGGTSAVTHFLPKLPDESRQSAFLTAYASISVGVALALLSALAALPELLTAAADRLDVSPGSELVLVGLVPVFLANQLVTFALAGLLEFRASALIAQLQLVTVVAFASLAYLFDPALVLDDPLRTLALVVGFANLAGVGVGATILARRLGWPRRPELPTGFWRFSGHVHVNSILAFSYANLDQLLVLAWIGIGDLGGYFIVLQIVQLIRFVPQRVGQVLLASFSRLVVGGEVERLRAVYQRLCRLSILLSTVLALSLIWLSRPIVWIFGEWLADHGPYLVLLAAVMNFGSVGPVNSMLILSKERTGAYLLNNLALSGAQLVTLVALMPTYGIYGAVWGRAIGMGLGQMGLFLIILRALSDLRLGIPRDFWLSQLVVGASAIVCWLNPSLSLPWMATGLLATSLLYALAARVRPAELTSLLPRRGE